MLQTLTQLAPIFVYFGFGVLLKQLSIAGKANGHFLLRLVFNLSLPLLIIIHLSSAPFTLNMALLPFANIAVCFACMLVTLLAIKVTKPTRAEAGTMLMNTMMVNSMFMLPFILLVYGSEGFVDAILFNVGNALLMGSYVYVLACKYLGKAPNNWTLVTNIIKSPLIWALIVALLMSLMNISLGYEVERVITPIAELTSPLILIAMGILVSFKLSIDKFAALSIFIRMIVGMLFGVSISAYLGFEGNTFIVVSLCAAAPIAVNAMTYLSVAKLDSDLDDKAVSASILLGLIYMPLLIVFVGGG